ncbi:MAG: quinolinate synthase NadA [Bdellovibrionales bacterium]|nr:quinolinate synthase NadA [Bdellovibrionales bacterium]
MDPVKQRILEIKKQRGDSLMILGHHYQRHAIVDVADRIGDSFGLAKAAAEAGGVRDIVFCGVRFMAESAAILCRDDQRVFHPEPEAGCPMADMAPMDSVEEAWATLTARPDFRGRKMIPVTYMNSHAPLKGFTGRHHGVVCTSSNARKTLEWAWSQGDLVLFFPDQHLGRNTAKAMGLRDDEMRVWYPSKPNGGIDSLEGVKLLLWNGHCPVHMKFNVRDVQFIRKNFPKAQVIVHPECAEEVVKACDASGSTEFIVKYVQGLPAGTQVFVGTEVNLVDRLKRENPTLKVEPLFRSLCPTMYMVDMEKLLRTLENLETEEPVPMPLDIKQPAREALERMLALA